MNGKTIAAVVAGCVVLVCLAFATGLPESLWSRAADLSPARPAQVELPVVAVDAPKAPAAPGEREAVAANDAVWPLIVTVQTRDGAPVPEAAVTVWTTMRNGVYWSRDASEFSREDVAAGATGADGVFRASLDALRERPMLLNRTAYLWIEASWPHDTPQYRIVELPRTRGPQQVTATIDLHRRGVVFTGRAVDGAGTTIARARVGTTRDGSTHVGSDAQTRHDGTFFVSWDGDADSWPHRIVVASPAHGSATTALPAWSAEQRAIDLGTIVLEAGDVVHGRAVLGDGSALAGIEIKAQAIDPSLGDDLGAIHRWLMRDGRRENISLALHERRAVWHGAQTHTLADGSFRFAGLKPDGVYLLSVWAVRSPADIVVRPGADPVELRIDQQLLAIDVFDEYGAAVPGAQVRFAGFDPSATHPSYQKWPGFPETGLVCNNWMPSAAPDGRRIFLVPFGFVFRVSLADDCVEPVAARHDVLPGVHRATCRLDVRSEERFGKLHICAVDENGKPIDVRSNKAAITSWRTLRVEEAGRECVVIPRDPSDPRPTREGAQITRFVTKQAFAPGRHSFLLRADGYQDATCEVDVIADKLTSVRVEMFPK